MVYNEPAGSPHPGVGPLDHPPFGQDDEPLGIRLNREQVRLLGGLPTTGLLVGRVPDHLNLDAMVLGDRLRAPTRIAGVDEQGLDARILRHGRSHDRVNPIPILDAGRRYRHRQQQPEGVDDEMAFASLDLLVAAS